MHTYRFLILFMLLIASCSLGARTAQKESVLTLEMCIERALLNRKSIEAARVRVQEQNLSMREIKARWLPEISLSYDYRFNPIIATTLIPIGQFDINNPTNTVRGIRMGSKWQQNGGMTLSQPLIDFAVHRALKRGKLEQSLAEADLEQLRQAVIYETTLSYLNICRQEQLLENAATDTLRSYNLLREQQARFENEQLLRSDLNRAQINHNDAIQFWEDNLTELTTEKIYLAFLIALPPASLVALAHFGFEEAHRRLSRLMEQEPQTDQIGELLRFGVQERIAHAELKEQKAKSLPTLSLDAFVGGNQYSEKLSPFEKNSWFGSSYIGISFKLPILYKENFNLRNQRYKARASALRLDRSDKRAQFEAEALMAREKWENSRRRITTLTENRELLREALRILNRRFEEKQATAFEVNLEEIELLKLQNNLLEQYREENLQILEYLMNSGLLNELAN
ncbi:MAG: TolC family protein [Bacteroidales bacterium]